MFASHQPYAVYEAVRVPYDDDDDNNKPVCPLGMWAPSSEGVRYIHINHSMYYVVKTTYPFVIIEESGHPHCIRAGSTL